MSLENNLAEIVTRFDDLAGKADAAEARMNSFIANARSDFAGLNLLKNARAMEPDGEGGFVSPLRMWFGDQPTSVSRRVLTPDDPDVPAEIAGKAMRDFPSVHFNVIELTLSQNGGTGYFMLLAGYPMRGNRTVGCLGAFTNSDGVRLIGTDLPQGELVENLYEHRNLWFNAQALQGSVTGNDVKLWIVGPFISPGYVDANSVFFALSSYHLINDDS